MHIVSFEGWMMKMNKWRRTVLRLIAWFLSALLVYWFILKLTGHSPTTNQIVLVGQGVIIVYIVKLNSDMNALSVTLKNYIREIHRRFFTLAKDFKRHLDKHD